MRRLPGRRVSGFWSLASDSFPLREEAQEARSRARGRRSGCPWVRMTPPEAGLALKTSRGPGQPRSAATRGPCAGRSSTSPDSRCSSREMPRGRVDVLAKIPLEVDADGFVARSRRREGCRGSISLRKRPRTRRKPARGLDGLDGAQTRAGGWRRPASGLASPRPSDLATTANEVLEGLLARPRVSRTR